MLVRPVPASSTCVLEQGFIPILIPIRICQAFSELNVTKLSYLGTDALIILNMYIPDLDSYSMSSFLPLSFKVFSLFTGKLGNSCHSKYRDPSKPNNYRSIIPTSVFWKVCGVFTSNQSCLFLEHEGLLGDCYYGFCSRLSTADLLVVISHLCFAVFHSHKKIYLVKRKISLVFDRF